jgi:hypothetical protein
MATHDAAVMAAAVAACVAVALAAWAWRSLSRGRAKAAGSGGGGGCQAHACGAVDPVSDPAYNMREIAKQSILLEEHLAESNKRCRDCIAKHFLHIQGLASEAQCLAGSGVARYPLMESNVAYYAAAFEAWLALRDAAPERWLPVQDRLRARRKELVRLYVLGDGEDGSGSGSGSGAGAGPKGGSATVSGAGGSCGR